MSIGEFYGKLEENEKKKILRALQCHCVLTLNSFEYFI
jgi:hypothetical protein